jgi:hypothetical protein
MHKLTRIRSLRFPIVHILTTLSVELKVLPRPRRPIRSNIRLALVVDVNIQVDQKPRSLLTKSPTVKDPSARGMIPELLCDR